MLLQKCMTFHFDPLLVDFCISQNALYRNQRSRTGLIVTLNGGPVICTSKIQTWTALSSSEAKLNAFASAINELKWLLIILIEIKAINHSAIDIKQDNLRSISWTQIEWLVEKDIGFPNVKLIGIKYHGLRDAVESKLYMRGSLRHLRIGPTVLQKF